MPTLKFTTVHNLVCRLILIFFPVSLCWYSKPAGCRIIRFDEECDINCSTCDTLVTLLHIKSPTTVLDSYLIMQHQLIND